MALRVNAVVRFSGCLYRSVIKAAALRTHRSLNPRTPPQQYSTQWRDRESDVTAQHPHTQHRGVFNLDLLVALLQQENAVDVCVIRVPEQLQYTQYLVLVSGSSPRHLRAMAQYAVTVFKFLKTEHQPHTHIEGRDCDDWMCIDFGSMVVHFMLPETRERFDLESLWTLRGFEERNATCPYTLPPDFILTHSEINSAHSSSHTPTHLSER